MLLAVDIGNTNIVFGLLDGDEIRLHWRVGTDKSKTSDEYGVLLKQLAGTNGLDKNLVTGTIISCVVPSILLTISNAVRKYFDVEPLIVGPGIKTGMPILYHNPKEVGADRIVNGTAAYDKYQRSVVVVDFGTATTFDCISEKGEYLGGVITPGLFISAEALYLQASKLPRVEIVKPPNVIGKTTIESIQSGLVFGYAGHVDAMIEKIKTEMKTDPLVIATGGPAKLISTESKSIKVVDEHLTLRGLRLLYERNI